MAPLNKLPSLIARQYNSYGQPIDNGLPGPAIAGIVVGVCFFFLVVLAICVQRRRYGGYYSSSSYYQYGYNRPNAQGVWGRPIYGTNSGNPVYPQSEFGPGNPQPMMRSTNDDAGLQAPPPVYSGAPMAGDTSLGGSSAGAVGGSSAAAASLSNT